MMAESEVEVPRPLADPQPVLLEGHRGRVGDGEGGGEGSLLVHNALWFNRGMGPKF